MKDFIHLTSENEEMKDEIRDKSNQVKPLY